MSIAGPLAQMEPHDIPPGALVMVAGLQGAFWWALVKKTAHDTEGHALYLCTMEDGLEGWWHRSSLVWCPRLAAAPAHAIGRSVGRA